jgi:hypothetical protein
MRGIAFVLGPVIGAALALTAACSDTGSDSDPNQGGASGEAGTAGSDTGGSAGNAVGGSAGSSGGRGGSAQGGSSGATMGGSSGTTTGGSDGGGGADSGGSGGAGGAGELCEDYTDGAFVEFEIVKETFRVWIENAAFITEAERLLAAGETRVPVFETLIDGTGCDPQWSWHADPDDVSFADFTIELCDAVPSYIEENKDDWFDQVGSWCPWSARVTAVTAR